MRLLERWQSGRMRRSWKPLRVDPLPGFESLLLRQFIVFKQLTSKKQVFSTKHCYQEVSLSCQKQPIFSDEITSIIFVFLFPLSFNIILRNCCCFAWSKKWESGLRNSSFQYPQTNSQTPINLEKSVGPSNPVRPEPVRVIGIWKAHLMGSVL